MALQKEKMVVSLGVRGLIRQFGVKANTQIYLGAMVALENGYAVPARAASNLVVVGIADESVSNIGASGDAKINVTRVISAFEISATDPVTISDVGSLVYAQDDETISKSSMENARSIAGKLFQIDGDQAFVEFIS